MAISIERYIRITSGRGAGAQTPLRQLIARLFTISSEIPTDTVAEFDNAEGVASYFGNGSDEHNRAIYYFGFVSKTITSPRTISFTRWANTDVGASILGASIDTTLTQLQAVTAGGFTITLAGTDGVVAGLDLSGAANFTAVAASLQTAIRAAGGTFANATVVHNPSRSRFEFGSGNTGDETIAITDGAQTPLALIGFDAPLARLSEGKDAQTPLEVVSETTGENNNFGSFLFTTDLTQDQHVAVAGWNQSQNVKFMYMVPVNATNASALSGAIIGFGGTSMELTDPTLNQYHEMLPMAILASTVYSNLNSTVNYMFHEDSRLTALVTTDPLADFYDPLRVNYIGQTQTAGAFIAFYQRGVLGGGTTDPVNQNTYANEQWLKDFNTAALLDMFRNLPKVSRNITGRAQGSSVIQNGVNAALFNGTISVGKTLTNIQREFITSQTGDANAYLQIENIGYWFDVTFRTDANPDGTTTEVMVYSLIYSKDDVVRMVDGRHILI